MHDTESDQRKGMPPLVVLGLTGPVGSGCTTVSKILSNKLLKALELVEWIKIGEEGEILIDWKGLNQKVDQIYDEIANNSKNIKDSNKADDLKEKVHRKNLNEMLELREATKALDKLKPYLNKNTNLFCRLSVSDLIVFHAFMSIEKDDFNIDHIKDDERRKKCRKFITIAKKYLNGQETILVLKKAGVKKYSAYYEKCRKWKDKDKNEIRRLGDAFFDICEIASMVKREFRKEFPYDYAEVLQDFGNNIRRCDNPFEYEESELPDYCCRLAEGITQFIYVLYKTRKDAFFVIDCLRNPYEVIYFRREFANFFLLSLFTEKAIRKVRILAHAKWELGDNYEEDKLVESFENADERDSGRDINRDRIEEVLYKQNVTKCVEISDIAINNIKKWTPSDKDTIQDFCRKSLRIICLILSPGCTKPNQDEMFMNLAYAMAVKSNCISRQVGAVIVDCDGYVVASGYNDVGKGKISCGLREIRDLNQKEFKPIVREIKKHEETNEKLMERLSERFEDFNDEHLKKQMCFCLKDLMAKEKTLPELKEAGHNLLQEEGRDNVASSILDTIIDPLMEKAIEICPLHQLEYCLALHAEEKAILQSAKIGGMGLKGGTIYVTSQPCSLCSKKIQQIELNKVVYTEAYPKGYSDIYLGYKPMQFEGVKPRAYIKLFMPHHDQKEWQDLESRGLVPMI